MAGRHLRLAQEALPEAVIRAELRREDLERDGGAEPRMLRAVNHAHSPAPNDGLDQIGAKLTADDQIVSHDAGV